MLQVAKSKFASADNAAAGIFECDAHFESQNLKFPKQAKLRLTRKRTVMQKKLNDDAIMANQINEKKALKQKRKREEEAEASNISSSPSKLGVVVKPDGSFIVAGGPEFELTLMDPVTKKLPVNDRFAKYTKAAFDDVDANGKRIQLPFIAAVRMMRERVEGYMPSLDDYPLMSMSERFGIEGFDDSMCESAFLHVTSVVPPKEAPAPQGANGRRNDNDDNDAEAAALGALPDPNAMNVDGRPKKSKTASAAGATNSNK